VIGADSHTCTYGALGAFSTGVGSTDLGVILATGKTWLKVPATIRLVYEGRLRPWVGGKDLILYTLGRLGVSGAVYCSLEFTGEVIGQLSMSHRFTMANMAVEAGAKNGIFAPDGRPIWKGDLTGPATLCKVIRMPLMIRKSRSRSMIWNLKWRSLIPLIT